MSNVIFDFDGTIADSLPLVLELYYAWSGAEPFTDNEISRLRDLTLKDVIADVGIPMWRVPGLLVKARKEFGKRLVDVPIFEKMKDVLAEIHDQGHKMYVISSNSPQNIRKFLKSQNIQQYFDGVHGNIGLFGKASAIRLIVRKHKLKNDECYYIGDETRDIDAAKKAHVKSIAVTWGYNGAKILKSHSPDFVATKPSAISGMVK